MEQLALPGQPLVAVDYAHTPDALEKRCKHCAPGAAARWAAVVRVRLRGDRDATKRPLMGAAAQHHADWVVATSDNPRSEDPAHILHQILRGTIAGETVRVEPDRAAAIALALNEADPADVVLIAGKGTRITKRWRACAARFQTWPRRAQRCRPAEAAHGHDDPSTGLGFVRQRIPSAHLVGDGATPWPVCTPTPAPASRRPVCRAWGERFDANAFLPQAQASGAAAALAHGGVAAAGLPALRCPTPGCVWRPGCRVARPVALPLIGVTGSNGKTTVTQMIASILRAWKGEAAFATQGNFNNDIGVPLMLLRCARPPTRPP